MSNLSCFSNHGLVLLILAKRPDSRLRDLAQKVGITERAVHRLIDDLEAAEALSRERRGRRVHYSVNRNLELHHPVESQRSIGDLVDMVWGA